MSSDSTTPFESSIQRASGSEIRSLGDRMKQYETVTRLTLPRRTYTVIRVDGKAFHSYLRKADRPFDAGFMEIMDKTAAFLCQEMSGTVLAYAQSDEISVLLTDFSSPGTEPWFGGGVQKMASVAASMATASFNWTAFEYQLSRGLKVESTARALFDARVFTIPDPVEVMNYFIWRQRDCVRNSISMAAQAEYSHGELAGKNGDQMQEMLWQKGINWNDYPDGAKRGRVCVRETFQDEITWTIPATGEQDALEVVRSRWVISPAPHFKVEPDSFLDRTIPVHSHPGRG